MATLSVEDTHELLDIVKQDNVRELLEEFIVLRGFDESLTISDGYIDNLVGDIVSGAVATGADVDVADWVQDLEILGRLAKGLW